MNDDITYTDLKSVFKPLWSFKTTHYPGYGGPESWELEVIVNNKLLAHETNIRSQYDLGKIRETFNHKFSAMSKEELDELVRNSPPASPLCYHCKGPTWEKDSTAIGEAVFCWRCEEFINEYREQRQEESDQFKKKEKERFRKELLARSSEAKELTKGAYHWQDNIYFNKTAEEIRISKISRIPEHPFTKYVKGPLYFIDMDWKIPRGEWDSIVLAMDGSAHEIQPGPCIICGKKNYYLSYGGSNICPACDCGTYDVNVLAQNNARLSDKIKELEAKLERPVIDVEIFCPKCRFKHIDAADEKNGWKNPPHHRHLCKTCGHEWEGNDVKVKIKSKVFTNGV